MTRAESKSDKLEVDMDPSSDGSADYTKMDPNTIVEIVVHDAHNAGKTPGTRFGRIPFDAEGNAKLKIALKDLVILNSWGWLSQEDQEKYLGLEAAQPQVIDEAQHNAELDAVRAANTKLAQRNADLEARLEDAEARFRKEFTAFQAATTAQIEELKKTAETQIFKLSTEFEAAVKERDMFKAQAEAAATADSKKKGR